MMTSIKIDTEQMLNSLYFQSGLFYGKNKTKIVLVDGEETIEFDGYELNYDTIDSAVIELEKPLADKPTNIVAPFYLREISILTGLYSLKKDYAKADDFTAIWGEHFRQGDNHARSSHQALVMARNYNRQGRVEEATHLLRDVIQYIENLVDQNGEKKAHGQELDIMIGYINEINGM